MEVDITKVTLECTVCGHTEDVGVASQKLHHPCDECGDGKMKPVGVFFEGYKKDLLVSLLDEAVILLTDSRGEAAWKSLIEDIRDGVEDNWEYFEESN